MLFSIEGRVYRRRPNRSQSSRLITVQWQPTSISAWIGTGNSVMRGPVEYRVACSWGTLKGTMGRGEMHESVSLSLSSCVAAFIAGATSVM